MQLVVIEGLRADSDDARTFLSDLEIPYTVVESIDHSYLQFEVEDEHLDNIKNFIVDYGAYVEDEELDSGIDHLIAGSKSVDEVVSELIVDRRPKDKAKKSQSSASPDKAGSFGDSPRY